MKEEDLTALVRLFIFFVFYKLSANEGVKIWLTVTPAYKGRRSHSKKLNTYHRMDY